MITLKAGTSPHNALATLLLQTKEEIAHSVKEELTKSMTSFGFSIIQTLVTGAPCAQA